MSLRSLILVPCTVAALAGFWLGAVSRFAPAPFEVDWIDGLYTRKELAARESGAGKILIVGGSGTHFGFSAERLTAATGIKAVNLGTHAGLGLEYLLYRAERSLNPGDTVVLAIEPTLMHDTVPSQILAAFVTFKDPAFLLRTSLVTGVRLVFGFSPAQLVKTWGMRRLAWTSPLYRVETVSAVGDETVRVSELSSPATRANLLGAPPVSAGIADPGHPPEALAQFLTFARERRVQVLQAWTPMLRNPAYATSAYERYYADVAQWFIRGGAVPVSHPSRYFLSIDDVFDWVMHANERGKLKATDALASEVCRVRQCEHRHVLLEP